MKELKKNPEAIVTLILGERGSGKSFFAKWYISKFSRYIIYDTQDEYIDGVVFREFVELKKFLLAHYTGDFRIIYNPLNPSNEAEFSELCEIVYMIGDMHFLVEELDLVADTFNTDMHFQSIIRRGRHKAINFIGISQRPFGINRNITSQAKEFYSFRQKEPRDVDYLKYYIGREAEEIPNLQEYEFLYWYYRQEKTTIRVLRGNDIILLKTLDKA